MVLVEFYDDRALENIAGTLYLRPEKVIFLGSKGKKMKKFVDNCQELLRERGMDTVIESRTINPANLMGMVDILCEILEENGQCEFNLTGGEETVMVALGMVYERNRELVQLHRINLNSGNFVDMDDINNEPWDGRLPELSVAELVKIYGGTILDTGIANNSSDDFVWDDEFVADIHKLWDLCREDCVTWNNQISNLEIAQKYGATVEDPLDVCLKKEEEAKIPGGLRLPVLFQKLMEAGYIVYFTETADTYRFGYKNEQIRKCLTKSGTMLELAVYLASSLYEEDGDYYFQDIRTSVYLDWDGNTHVEDNQTNTVNEIDVIMMHHLVPYFVSCKNGAVSVDELYKMYVVANHFGYGYARKFLVLTDYAMRHPQNFAFIRERAKDMGIFIINEVQKFDIPGLGKEIRRFCQ